MTFQSDAIKTFFELVAPGFVVEGVVPAVKIEGIEVGQDGHAIARVEADGRILGIRFTFEEDKIARVEVL